MAKQTLHVTDKSGKRIGVLFLYVGDTTQDKSTLFESVSPFLETENPQPQVAIEKRSFWASDGINSVIMGLFAGGIGLGVGLYYDLPLGPIVAGGAFLTGIGLYVYKIVRMSPAAPSEPAPKATTIQIEQVTSDGKHWLIEQLDESITMSELRSVAAAVMDTGKWTRRITTRAGLSQGKHQKLQSDFVRLHYLEPFANGANGYRLTGMGRRFLLQVNGA